MFIQVVQGRVTARDALEERFDAWHRSLAPGAKGWLGSTGGITADGELVMVVRFADEASARANSSRPEQDAWWNETSGLIEGPVFHDYPDAEMWLGGGSDDAGFVQVIQGVWRGEGTPADVVSDADAMAEMRPDVIGGTYGMDDRGHFTQTVYFTSEEEARKGERDTADDPDAERMAEWMAKVEGLRYLDLTEPWMASP